MATKAQDFKARQKAFKRWLTTKLEEALRETREARDKAEDQIRFLAGEARLNKKPKKGGITWLNTDAELVNEKEKS